MIFHIFQCSIDPTLYCSIDEADPAKLPAEACTGGEWIPVKDVEESGKSRIVLDEEKARKDIEANGYHLYRSKITMTVKEGKKP